MERIETHDRDNHKQPLSQLISGIIRDAQTLIAKEVAAAKLEFKQEVSKAVAAGVSLGIGAFLLVVGFGLLTLMLVFLLTTYTEVPLWGGFGIIGLLYCVVGAILAIVGKRKVSEVKPIPQDALQETKEDVRYIADRASPSSRS